MKDGDGWKIAFTPNDTELSTYAGKKSTFDMKLKKNAVTVGPNGNTNKINLDYSTKFCPKQRIPIIAILEQMKS